MDAVYWDTSALLKLYAAEPDSSKYVQELIRQPEPVAISELHNVEMYFALRMKAARGEIITGTDRTLFSAFSDHIDEERYLFLTLGSDAIRSACCILDDCLSSGDPVWLRSLDGLHLGVLRAAGIRAVVSADSRMREAARLASIVPVEV